MELIDRPVYTRKILPFIGKGIIKVLTGQRRVGKSCILQQLMNVIKRENPEANIILTDIKAAINSVDFLPSRYPNTRPQIIPSGKPFIKRKIIL